MRAKGAACRPIWAGTPATEGYPIDSGISSAATLMAAIRSGANDDPPSYFGNQAPIGNHRSRLLGPVGRATT
jgi:hypothetical protein